MYLARERYKCKSIHHMGSDRASCRMLIALGENHREQRDLEARVTWSAVNDSSSDSRSTPVDNVRQGRGFKDLAPVDKTIPQWTPVVFHRRTLCQQFFLRYGPFKRGGFAAPFERTRAEELHAVLWVTSQRVEVVVRRVTRSSWHCAGA